MKPYNAEIFLAVARDLLSRGHRVRFRAEGDSMYPTIRGGETIIVEPAPGATMRAGEIALYHTVQRVFAHRVVRTERRWPRARLLIVRGDAAGGGPEPVEPDRVLGKVVAVERDGRNVSLCGWRGRVTVCLRRHAAEWKARILSIAGRHVPPAEVSR